MPSFPGPGTAARDLFFPIGGVHLAGYVAECKVLERPACGSKLLKSALIGSTGRRTPTLLCTRPSTLGANPIEQLALPGEHISSGGRH